MRIPIIALRVLDQDRALKFYTETLGFTVTEDMDFGGHMRWITVSPPDAPEQEVLLERVGPPIVDQETADQIDALSPGASAARSSSRSTTAARRSTSSSPRASRSSRSRWSASTASTPRSATTRATTSA